MKRTAPGEILYGFQAYLYALPFLLAMSACSGIDVIIVAALYAVFACLGIIFKTGIIAIQVPAFLPLLFIYAKFGFTQWLISAVAAVAFTALFLRLPAEKISNKYITPALFLMLAFCSTALFTTDYFGIGATGATVREILASYRYLGFHPNWRGVLYGTITLVLMITYARKFKRLKNYLPAPLVALAVPYILNLFLNPVQETTVINEAVSLYGTMAQSAQVSVTGVLYALIGGFSSAYAMQLKRDERNTVVYGAPKLHEIESDRHAGFAGVSVYVILLFVTVFLFKDIFTRIPIHSLAVVLIAAGWQCVDWGKIAGTFKSGFWPAVATLSVFAQIFFIDAAAAVLIALLISLLFNGVHICSKK